MFSSSGRSADSANNAASGEFDPGRAGVTVSPEPQADTLLRCKRISGPNVTPARPGSNSPEDDDDNDDDDETPGEREGVGGVSPRVGTQSHVRRSQRHHGGGGDRMGRMAEDQSN